MPLGSLDSDSTVTPAARPPKDAPANKPIGGKKNAPASNVAASAAIAPDSWLTGGISQFDALFGGDALAASGTAGTVIPDGVNDIVATEANTPPGVAGPPRGGGRGYAPPPPKSEEEAAMESALADRAKRASMIGANIKGLDKLSSHPLSKRVPGTPGLHAPSVKPMSQEEYDKLSDTQKAAVDFNTMLGKAVRRDTKLQSEYDPTDEQKATYDATVKEIFGEDGGSEYYAPETLALLRQVMYDDSSADLDDFLGMNMAVTAGALSTIDIPSTEADKLLNPFGNASSKPSAARELALKTNDMEEKIAAGTELMQTVTAMSKAQRQEAVGALGGIQRAPVERLGYKEGSDAEDAPMQQQVDAYFVKAFDKLAQKGTADQTDEILGTIRKDLMGAEKDSGMSDLYKRFMNYADSRSRISLDYGQALAQGTMPDGTPGEYQTPEQFRVLLGLSKGEK